MQFLQTAAADDESGLAVDSARYPTTVEEHTPDANTTWRVLDTLRTLH
jgi:hypothetical protein